MKQLDKWAMTYQTRESQEPDKGGEPSWLVQKNLGKTQEGETLGMHGCKGVRIGGLSEILILE